MYSTLPLRLNRGCFKQTFINHLLPICRPCWSAEQIKFNVCKYGTTNLLVDVSRDSCSSPELILRVNGENTEKFIDREYEVAVMHCLYKAGIGPQLHYKLENGLCYSYLPGRHLQIEELYDPVISRKVAARLALMHNLQPPHTCGRLNGIPRLYQFLEEWMDLISSQTKPSERWKQSVYLS